MSAPDYIDVATAAAAGGIRLVLTRGVPGPWSLAARAIFDLKRIPYIAAPQEPGEPNETLQAWTGQSSAPVAVLDRERPRAHWSEILLLAESLEPEPPLIPHGQDDRTTMFGIGHELCGEDGLGWCLRALLLRGQQAAGAAPFPSLVAKYAARQPDDHLAHRVRSVIAMLDERLARQQDRGSAFLVGDALSAADIYWMAFSNLVAPMAAADCVMPDYYPAISAALAPYLGKPVPRALLAFRDRIVADNFERPLAL